MGITATLKIVCDLCGQELELVIQPHQAHAADIFHLLENNGWQYNDADVVICPDCQTLVLPDLNDLPQKVREIVEYRLWVIEPLLHLENRTRADVEARAEEVRRILLERGEAGDKRSPTSATNSRSIYRWVRAYENNNYDWQALVTNYDSSGAKGVARVEPDVDTIIGELIEEHLTFGQKKTIEQLWDELASRIADRNSQVEKIYWVPVPDKSTLHRRLLAHPRNKKRTDLR